MGRQIPSSVWLKYEALRESGIGRPEAARRLKISYDSAARYDRGEIRTSGAGRVEDLKEVVRATASEVKPPIAFEDLGDVPREALFDFDLFRERYLGRVNKPWQSDAAKIVVEFEDTEEREWIVINVPPGSGKSTTFTHDIPCWLIVRGRVLNRDTRIMIGSRTQRQANQYGRRLRATLMRTRPVDGADGVLVKDYGYFEPLNKLLWRAEEFTIWASADEQPTDEKEPTVMCVGMDTGFLGGRFNFVIWDDLVDASTNRTVQAREKQREWFDDEAETRLEPGGLFLLQGQRLGADDLYRYALDKEMGDGEKKYRHVVYPAHADDLCADNHGEDAEPWPDGCLLDPDRLSWRDLRTVKANNPRKFDIIMQQKDVDGAGTLVPREFIEGGMWNSMDLPGCLDMERSLCQYPSEPNDRLISVVSVDPSPTKFWSVQWWIYDPDTELRWLMDLHRESMDAPDFLDRLRDGRYVGVMQDWAVRANEMGFPLSCVIVEQNAAQRFLLQYEYVRDWSALHGINIIPHNTGYSNKSDEAFGVQTLRPHYMYGRIRLPYGDIHTRTISDQIIEEVVAWPDGRTDDCVMAQWMFEWNLPNLAAAQQPLPKMNHVPSWIRGKSHAL